MSRLYLVRHAQTMIDPNKHHSEWQLDPAGEPALAKLAALPCFSGCTRLYSSSEPKALFTADRIAVALGGPAPVPVHDLRELHKGGYLGDYGAAMRRLFAEPDKPAAEGTETAAAALARFKGALTPLLQLPEDLIVVTHGTVLALYLADIQGQDRVDFDAWRAIRMPDLAIIDTDSMQVIQPFGAWD